ncbi:MAG TPA: (4Fe-4S)-binding protein [Methanomicrobia archaeon]|nr:(4Fe-4S)-binding protein [Methanomicrobia archaeon]
MRIAIASGKGGTGKTTVATGLAHSIGACTLLDCDVEEPDDHHYLGISLSKVCDVTVPTPSIDGDLCTHCGDCSSFCRYNALAVLPTDVLVFPQMCNGCGGCSLVCPVDAIDEKPRRVGIIEGGTKGQLTFFRGLLTVGEARAPPVIHELKTRAKDDAPVILDAPPGSSCPTVEALEGCDYAILVTEPTLFGLHDLEMVIGLANDMKMPYGVIVNKHGAGDIDVDDYLANRSIPVIATIPHSREIAVAGSNGIPLSAMSDQWRDMFVALFDTIRTEVSL